MNIEEVDRLHAAIKLDYPFDADTILKLCLNEVGFPSGYYHIDILLDALKVDFPDYKKEELRIVYIYLTAYYFLLDSTIDGHIEVKEHNLFLTHLLTGAICRLSKFLNTYFPEKFNECFNLLLTKISENAAAVKNEYKHKENPFEPSERGELENIVGRANSSVFLLELIGIVTNNHISNNLRNIIYEFLYFMQLGDDLGDWRIDFEQKNYTSFLRLCFARLKIIPKEIHQLESFVYGSGIYEERAINILKGFDCVLKNINSSYFKLEEFILKQRDRLNTVLTDFIATKIYYVK